MATSEITNSWFDFALPSVKASLKSMFADSPEHILAADVFLTSCTISIVLIGFGLLARAGLNKAMAEKDISRFHADTTLSPRNIMEMFVSFIDGNAKDNLDPKTARSFSWLFCGLFIYIFCSNIVGILPGGVPPSQSISNNFAMSLLVLIVFVGAGVKSQGIGYFTHMAGPVPALYILMFPIELFGAFIVRPASLAVRLAGNLNGDHTVLGVTYQLSEVIGGTILPVIALGLGSFVSFIQAFVFTLLTVVYVALSVHDDHDEHH